MQSFAPWPSPGGVSWSDFVGHVRFFAALCERARRAELAQWGPDTLEQALRWAEFMEQLEHDLGAGRQQAQAYMSNPNAFIDNSGDGGADSAASVVRTGLSVKILGAAEHFVLRQLLSNPNLPENIALLKQVMQRYLAMGEGDEEEIQQASSMLVKDLVKEAGPRLRSRIAFERLQQLSERCVETVPLSMRDVHDAEVRFFLHPSAVKAWGVSRALVAQRGCWDVGAAVKLCRKCPHLLYALMMTCIPRPLFLGPPKSEAEHRPPPSDVEQVVTLLLRNQGWLGLWQVEPWLLAQLAASSQVFSDALVTQTLGV